MNVKKLIFPLILLANAPFYAMAPAPGTVIDPIKHTGQFTVSMAEHALGSSSIPQITHAGSELFTNKGVPVIITTAASMVPWWALTTGTGYLLISQCGISDPALLATVASGASYAAGQQSGSILQKYINNPYVKNIAKAALCASCLGLSYISSNPLITDALFATAQAIGLQTLADASSQISIQPKINTTHNQTHAWYALSPETKANLMEASVNTLSTILPSLCITNACDPHAMLRILLYEQAYRLAQSGCAAAHYFVNK